MMGEPPVDAGAAQDTVTWPLPATPDTAVGAEGAATGTSGVIGVANRTVLALLTPAPLVACTKMEYDWPLARPVSVHVVSVAAAGEHVLVPPGKLATTT